MDIDNQIELKKILSCPQGTGVDPITWTWFDQLINHRTIIFNEEICESIVQLVYCQLNRFENDDSDEPVTLILNTTGGYVFDSLFLVNVIDNYSKPLNIICPGYCLSMGAILLCAGNKNPNVHKYCYPFSIALIHAGDIDLQGEANTVKDTMSFTEELDNKIKDYVVKNTAIPESEWQKHLRRQWYLTSEQMLKYKMVDEIIGTKKE